jgi:toxin HigB-1
VIVSFADKETERIWREERSRRLPSGIQQQALDRLQLLHAATRLEDLRVPPGNRLEALEGDRRGQHGVRLNEQWRLCFRWEDGNAHGVEIVDYH